MKSLIGSLKPLTRKEREAFLCKLSENAQASFLYLFSFWALAHQNPPKGDWGSWLILGGRGSGKTRAGAEWVRSLVEGNGATDPGECRRLALIGETVDQVREVMIFGDSGIIASSPPDRKPVFEAGRRRLVWPNGAEAKIYSAHDPESLRGPQFDAAWLDEYAKWPKSQEVWDNLRFALRLGERPRVLITTTPRSTPAMRKLIARSDLVTTRATTQANIRNLAPSFVESIEADYAGTRLGRQEIAGELLDDIEGAIWRAETLESAHQSTSFDLTRIVVAVDPPVTSHKKSDACGIVIAGVRAVGSPLEWKARVLADWSLECADAATWSARAVKAFHHFGANAVVVEVNQGGDLVKDVLAQSDATVPIRPVRASHSKVARAEPVALLYEQGRVFHAEPFEELENQMMQFAAQGYQGAGSPDRVDALVWALSDLVIEPAKSFQNPKFRQI